MDHGTFLLLLAIVARQSGEEEIVTTSEEEGVITIATLSLFLVWMPHPPVAPLDGDVVPSLLSTLPPDIIVLVLPESDVDNAQPFLGPLLLPVRQSTARCPGRLVGRTTVVLAAF